MITFITTIIVFAVALFLFNLLMGYKKGNITLDLDGRHTNQKEQAHAVVNELKKQGMKVEYSGNGQYVINGKAYVVHQRNVAMGGAPLQRTVLVPVKG